MGTIGPDPTDTLLGYLPPVGWADVATSQRSTASSPSSDQSVPGTWAFTMRGVSAR